MLIFPWKVRCKPGKTSLCKRGSTAFKPQGFTSNNIFLRLLLHLPVQVALRVAFLPGWLSAPAAFISDTVMSASLPQSQQQESSVLKNLSSDIKCWDGQWRMSLPPPNTLPGLVTQAGSIRSHEGVRLPGFQKEKKEMGTMILYSVMLRHFLEETFSYP